MMELHLRAAGFLDPPLFNTSKSNLSTSQIGGGDVSNSILKNGIKK